jgi:hypothetical protein
LSSGNEWKCDKCNLKVKVRRSNIYKSWLLGFYHDHPWHNSTSPGEEANDNIKATERVGSSSKAVFIRKHDWKEYKACSIYGVTDCSFSGREIRYKVESQIPPHGYSRASWRILALWSLCGLCQGPLLLLRWCWWWTNVLHQIILTQLSLTLIPNHPHSHSLTLPHTL